MKKLDREQLRFQLTAADKRLRRSLREQHSGKRKRKRRRREGEYAKPIEAPAHIDIYRSNNRAKFLQFLKAIKQRAQSKGTTYISFRNARAITAAAGLLLVSETDKLVKANPNARFKCSFPPVITKGRYRNTDNLVESSLKQIGFFKLIGQQSTKLTNQASVKRWKQLSGDTADGSLAASLIRSLADNLPEKARKRMYRGAIEAIANCVEHAYPSDAIEAQADRRWWMLVGIDREVVSVIVCDLGVGIPVTLPKHPPRVINRIFSRLGISRGNDGELIRASTYIRQTRTELKNRGKGGLDVRSIVDAFPSAQLTIRSNRGAYTLLGNDCKGVFKDRVAKVVEGTNSREAISNHRESIGGTIIEWVLNTKDFTK